MTKKNAVNTLTINFQEGDLPSLHPHDLVIYLRGISLSKLLFEGLTRIDEEGKVDLAGAQSLDISEDRLHYIFHLRDNKWSDGTPVTAYHFEQGWKEALSPTSTCSRANLLYILANGEKAKRGEVPLDAVGVKALDEKTLTVDLAYPSSFFLDLLAQPICAPIQNLKEKQMPCVNGPFSVEKIEQGACIHLKRNPLFWNAKHVSLDQIDIFTVADSGAILNLYETGQLDWIGMPHSPFTAEQMENFQEKKDLISEPVDRLFWIYLNTSHPLLASPEIRHALSLAIDRRTIADQILMAGPPLRRILSDSLLPVKQRPSLLLKEDEKEALDRFHAGLSALGKSKEDLPPLVISYGQQSNRKQLAEYLQQTWKRVLGIDVRIQQKEWNVLRRDLEKGRFDVFAGYEASYYSDPLEIMEKFERLNPSNFSQWENSKYFSLLQTVRQKDGEKTQFLHFEDICQLLAKGEEILLRELPVIPVCTDRFVFAHRKGLKGYAFDSVGSVDLSYASFTKK